MNIDIEKFEKENFNLGEVKFRINKLSALKAYKVFEKMRKQLAHTLDSVTPNGENPGVTFFKSILALDDDFVEEIRQELFKSVIFTGNGVKDGALGGLEDTAFQHLEPVHIYEVLARCLVVNFTKSLHELTSKYL